MNNSSSLPCRRCCRCRNSPQSPAHRCRNSPSADLTAVITEPDRVGTILCSATPFVAKAAKSAFTPATELWPVTAMAAARRALRHLHGFRVVVLFGCGGLRTHGPWRPLVPRSEEVVSAHHKRRPSIQNRKILMGREVHFIGRAFLTQWNTSYY